MTNQVENQAEHDAVEQKSLTDWKNAPTVRDLKQNWQDAKPHHDAQVSKINGYLDNLNITGSAKLKLPDNSSKIQPKLIRKQAEWRYASLSEPFLSTTDIFNVRPKTAEDRKAAQQNSLLLNHQLNHAIDKTKFVDEYVRTAVDEGTVIIRVGWDFKEEQVEEQVPVVEFRVNPELAPLHEQLAQMKQETPSLYLTDVPQELKDAHDLTIENGAPIEPVIVGQKMETKSKTVRNQPTIEIVDSRNVTLDPTGEDEFLGFSFESNYAKLKADGKYKNLDKINIEGNSPLAAPDHTASGDTSFNFADKPRKKLVVYEYWGKWDIHGDDTLVPIVAAWVGDTMVRLQENPFPDKEIPFVVKQYLPVRRESYGEPDGALLEDNQKILGAITRGIIDMMGKSANGQTGIMKGMLDATNRVKFDKGLDYEFNMQTDPRQGVHQHVYPEIPASAQFMIQLANQDSESLTGVKTYADSGISGRALGDVSSLGRSALDAASKRELGILRRLSSGLVEVGHKVIAMNAEFLDEEEVIRVTDEEFVTVRKDDLGGKFDLELSISTAEEDNNKAEQLAFLLQTIGPSDDPQVRRKVMADIARLRKMPDMARWLEEYEPQPDPLAQKLQELEIAKIEMEIAEIQAQIQKLQTAAQLDMAKAGTEGVKAGNLQSDTDQKNLDFVEQQEGVTQERAKELHGEQARAQAKTAIIKASMDQQTAQEKGKIDLIKEFIKNSKKETV